MPPMIAMAIGTAVSGASSGKSGKGKPSGQTDVTTNPFSAQPINKGATYLGSLLEGFQGGNPYALGSSPLDPSQWSPQTNAGLGMAGDIASRGSSAVGPANDFLNNILKNNFGNTGPFGGFLTNAASGNFNSMGTGFGGLNKTAGGDFLPGRMPTVSGGGGVTQGGNQGPPGADGSITVGGSGNPFLDSLMTQAAQNAQGATNSSFSTAGRFGGGANVGALQSNVLDATSRAFTPIYQQERGLQQQAQGLLGQSQQSAATTGAGIQMQAAGMAPALDTAQYIDPTALQSVGSIYDNNLLGRLNAPYQAGVNYMKSLGGGSGGTTGTDYFTNPLGSALGSGLGAYSMAKQAGMGSGSGGGKGGKGGKAPSNNMPGTDMSYAQGVGSGVYPVM